MRVVEKVDRLAVNMFAPAFDFRLAWRFNLQLELQCHSVSAQSIFVCLNGIVKVLT